MENTRKKILEIENEFINQMGQIFSNIGGQQLVGRTWGLLIAQDKPVSLNEISKRLKVSKSAVSTAVRVGESSFFKRVYNDEHPRQNFYTIHNDVVDFMENGTVKKMEIFTNLFKLSLDNILKIDKSKMDETDRQKLQKFETKIKDWLDFFNYLGEELFKIFKKYREKQ